MELTALNAPGAFHAKCEGCDLLWKISYHGIYHEGKITYGEEFAARPTQRFSKLGTG